MKLLIRIIACLELLIGIIQMIVQITSYSRMAAGYGLTLPQILFQEGAIAEVTPKIVIALGFFGVLMALSAFIDGFCKLFGTKETTAGAYGNITADEEGEDDDVKVEIIDEDTLIDGNASSEGEADASDDDDAGEDANDDESTEILDSDDTKDEDASDALADEVRKLRDERKQAESDSTDAKAEDAKADEEA